MATNVGDAADEIFNDNSRTLAPAAVGSQVALMTVISVCFLHLSLHAPLAYHLQVVTILLFNILRPQNKVCSELFSSSTCCSPCAKCRSFMNLKSSTTSVTSHPLEYRRACLDGYLHSYTPKSLNSWTKLV